MKPVNSSKRNGEIDLLRFVFAALILFAHFHDSFKFGIFPQAHIGVEFFFLVSGFLMAATAHKYNNISSISGETVKFIFKKIKSFYVFYILAIIFNFIVRYVIAAGYSFADVVKAIYSGIPNYILTFMGTGTSGPMYVSGNWYLSVMILLMAILFPMLLKWKKTAGRIIFPVAAIFILGYLYASVGHISGSFTQRIGIFNTGTLRGAAEIMLGCTLYECVDFINRYKANKAGRIFFSVLKYAAYAAVILYTTGKLSMANDIHALFFMVFAVGLSFSELPYRIQPSKVTDWLGKYSLPLYLFHGTIRYTAQDVLGRSISDTYVIALMAASFVLALIMMYLCPLIGKGFGKFIGLFEIKNKTEN